MKTRSEHPQQMPIALAIEEETPLYIVAVA